MHQGCNPAEELTPAPVRRPRGHSPALVTGPVSRYQKPSVSYFPGERPVLSLGNSATCCLEDYGPGKPIRGPGGCTGKDSDHKEDGGEGPRQSKWVILSGGQGFRHKDKRPWVQTLTLLLAMPAAWGQIRLLLRHRLCLSPDLQSCGEN